MKGELLINTGNIRYKYNTNNIEITREEEIDFLSNRIYIVPNKEKFIIKILYASPVYIEDNEEVIFDSNIKVNLEVIKSFLDIEIIITEIVEIQSEESSSRKIVTSNIFKERVRALGKMIKKYTISNKTQDYKRIDGDMNIEIKFVLEVFYEDKTYENKEEATFIDKYEFNNFRTVNNGLIDVVNYKVKNIIKDKNKIEAIKTVVKLEKIEVDEEKIRLLVKIQYNIKFYFYSIEKLDKNTKVIIEEHRNYEKLYYEEKIDNLKVKEINTDYILDENKDLDILTEIEYIPIIKK